MAETDLGSVGYFESQFELAAVSVALVVGVQTSLYFGHKLRGPHHKILWHFATAAAAGACTVVYALVRIIYFFTLFSDPGCRVNKVIPSLFRGLSNALVFTYLAMRAHAVNKSTPQWKRWRWLSLFLLLLSYASFLLVASTRKSPVKYGPGGWQCVPETNDAAFVFKSLVEFVNQIVQTAMFIWPLAMHVRHMGASSANGQTLGATAASGLRVYKALVYRAAAAGCVAAAVELIACILVILATQIASLDVPALPTIVNICNVSSVYFAAHGVLGGETPVLRQRSAVADLATSGRSLEGSRTGDARSTSGSQATEPKRTSSDTWPMPDGDEEQQQQQDPQQQAPEA